VWLCRLLPPAARPPACPPARPPARPTARPPAHLLASTNLRPPPQVFTFEFVNSYGALAYVAYVKGPTLGLVPEDECENGDCLGELSSAMAIIFIAQLATGNISEVGGWVGGWVGAYCNCCNNVLLQQRLLQRRSRRSVPATNNARVAVALPPH
jgi:hypothetical protein